MTEPEKLLDLLREDHTARLRHAVLREAGVRPFSLRALLISDRQIIRYACHLALDREREESDTGTFSMERFIAMKEASNGGI